MIQNDLDDRYITETYLASQGRKFSLEFLALSNEVVDHLAARDITTLPDFIVLDPGKGGFGVLEQLKTHTRLKEIPVILVTELLPASAVKEAYRLGANSVIQKPSTHELTAEKIDAFAKYWFDIVEL